MELEKLYGDLSTYAIYIEPNEDGTYDLVDVSFQMGLTFNVSCGKDHSLFHLKKEEILIYGKNLLDELVKGKNV